MRIARGTGTRFPRGGRPAAPKGQANYVLRHPVSSTTDKSPDRTASTIDSLSAEHTRNTPRSACADIFCASVRSAHREIASAFHCTLVWFQVLLRASTRAPQWRHTTGTMGIAARRLSSKASSSSEERALSGVADKCLFKCLISPTNPR